MRFVSHVLVLFALFAGLGAKEAAAARPTFVLLGTVLADADNNAIGLAGFQSVTHRGRTNTYFEMLVGRLSVPANSTVSVLVNGVQVATATVRPGRGSTTQARVILNSARGDVVPAIVAGDVITVADPTSGATLATGTFRRFR